MLAPCTCAPSIQVPVFLPSRRHTCKRCRSQVPPSPPSGPGRFPVKVKMTFVISVHSDFLTPSTSSTRHNGPHSHGPRFRFEGCVPSRLYRFTTRFYKCAEQSANRRDQRDLHFTAFVACLPVYQTSEAIMVYPLHCAYDAYGLDAGWRLLCEHRGGPNAADHGC